MTLCPACWERLCDGCQERLAAGERRLVKVDEGRLRLAPKGLLVDAVWIMAEVLEALAIALVEVELGREVPDEASRLTIWGELEDPERDYLRHQALAYVGTVDVQRFNDLCALYRREGGRRGQATEEADPGPVGGEGSPL